MSSGNVDRSKEEDEKVRKARNDLKQYATDYEVEYGKLVEYLDKKIPIDVTPVSDWFDNRITNVNDTFDDAKWTGLSYTPTTHGYISAGGRPVTIQGGVPNISWGCGECPDFVLGVLTQDCREVLGRVRHVKRIVFILKRLLKDLAGQILSDLRHLASLIPYPPIFDISAIVRMLSCPLTPQAIIVEQLVDVINYVEREAAKSPLASRIPAMSAAFTTYSFRAGTLLATLDPKALLRRLGNMIKMFIQELKLLVETFLEKMKGSAYVRIIWRYFMELYHLVASLPILVIRIAVTTASVMGVRATCPDIYQRPDLPFIQYMDELKEFSLDGAIPNDFKDEEKEFAKIVMEIQGKLALWQAAPILLLV